MYFNDSSPNMIIKGDNRVVLDKLISKYEKKIKCIYIDPPYNNGENYTHYTDKNGSLEWLENMKDILPKLYSFLSDDGSLWVSIDDTEVHYLKVLMDDLFGRNKFITTIIWQQRTTRENRSTFSNNHEYILVYAKNPLIFKMTRNFLKVSKEVLDRYKNPDNDPRGPWQSISLNVQAGHAVSSQFYDITAPNGHMIKLPKGRCWAYNREKMENEIKCGNIWFGLDGNGVPRRKKFLKDANLGMTPETLWLAKEVGTTKSAKKHLISLNLSEKLFDTPKPEELLKRILEIATDEGDMVLDAYLGSGTTASVAHKMNRRYIGIEMGDHINDIVIPRLDKVIEGEQGGISKMVNWQGGGKYIVDYEIGKMARQA